MQCPKCESPMSPFTFSQITVDQCDACKGVWFDLRELEQLLALEGSEIIDEVSPSVGSGHNEMGDYDCPKCLHRMSKMVHHQQPHIWYEQCPGCGSVYLDAGEFSDIKELTLADRVKAIFAKPRME